jgi:hypothetical protein
VHAAPTFNGASASSGGGYGGYGAAPAPAPIQPSDGGASAAYGNEGAEQQGSSSQKPGGEVDAAAGTGYETVPIGGSSGANAGGDKAGGSSSLTKFGRPAFPPSQKPPVQQQTPAAFCCCCQGAPGEPGDAGEDGQLTET